MKGKLDIELNCFALNTGAFDFLLVVPGDVLQVMHK